MKIKTLAIAAATLAVGAITSQAQVYSQNIVGYCNVILPAGPSYTLLANPFDNGQGNVITNWIDSNNALPNKSAIYTWNGATFSILAKGGGSWGAAGATTTNYPGSGFFVYLPATQTSPITNTFSGTIIVPSGGSVTNVIASGYNCLGSPIPYAADLILDTTNLAVSPLLLVNKSAIYTWNGTTYNIASLGGGTWGSSTAPLTVGAGFFVFQKGAYSTNWIQKADY